MGSPVGPHGSERAHVQRALWIRAHAPTVVMWLAAALVTFAVTALVFAALWSASLDSGVSSTAIWVWAGAAALRLFIAAGVSVVAARTQLPTVLLVLFYLLLGGVFAVELASFFIAMAVTDGSGWIFGLVMLGIVVSFCASGGPLMRAMIAATERSEARAAQRRAGPPVADGP